MDYVEDLLHQGHVVLSYEVDRNPNTGDVISPPNVVLSPPMPQSEVAHYISLLDEDCIGGVDAFDEASGHFIGSTEL